MQYAGNRLMSVTDGNSAPMLYDYDADGNRTADGRTGLEFSYNILNLPCEVHDGQQNMQMRYTYLSDGTKVSALDAAGKGHLGNVRSVIDLSGLQNASTASLILEQDDYLPYGTKVVNGSQSSLSSNRYRYAGKEEQRIGSFSSQLLDFGARSYDPWTCRWTTVDPLAQKYFGMSPYIYCGNDPVNRFDPDGRIVVIWYEENGEMKSYRYSGGECTCNNEYVQAVVEAYIFDKENWHKAGFEGKSPIEQLVERTDASCNIINYPNSPNEFYPINGGIANINWSSDEGSEFNGGIVVSPATILAHEADHANDFLNDSYMHSCRTGHDNSTYDTDEEERVIKGSEQKTAYANGEIKKGQVTRRNHEGKTVKVVGGPTSHKKLKS